MATEQVVIDFDDQALFQSALEDTAPSEPISAPPSPTEAEAAPPTSQATPPTPSAPARDDLGRFVRAPAQPEQEQPPSPAPARAPPVPEEDGPVPSWRLREEREQREAYATRLAERDAQLNQALAYIQRIQAAQQQQQAPPPPDPLLNPAEWQAYNQQGMQQLYANIAHQIRTNQLESNLQLTRLERTPELFDAAYAAFMRSAEGDTAFARSIVNSPNPGAAMCDWYQRALALETYGADPEAYFNKRIEGLLQDRSFLARAIDSARSMAGQPARPSNNVTVLPPSLTSMRSGSTPETGVSGPGFDDAMSDQALFNAALAPNQARR